MTTGLDTTEFQAALRQTLALTQRTLAEALNTHMFYIARGASRLTPVSQKLEQDLGVIAYKSIRSKKTGKTRKGKAIYAINTGNRFAAIINARRAKMGEAPVPKAEMAEKVKKLLAARLRSKGTERAGWLAAIRKLGRILGIASYSPDRTSVTHTSIVSPAKDGWSPEVELEYRIISTDTDRKEYIDPKTEQALQRAFDEEAVSMQAKTAQRLQRNFNAVNPKP